MIGRGKEMNDIIITSFATAVFTIIGTYGVDRYKNFKSTNLKRMSILYALNAELMTLKALIKDRKTGFEMTRASFPSTTLSYIPISYNYFSVFDNLSAEFGLINNPGVSKLIISTYIEIKGLFENVKDLGSSAQFIQKLSVTSGIDTKIIEKLIVNENMMLNFLLNEQVPKLLQLIDSCGQEISNERIRIQNTDNFYGFLHS